MKQKRYYGSDAPKSSGPHPDPMSIERLTAAAIIRNGDVLERGFKSHWQLRQSLDPTADPRMGEPGDVEGFTTSTGRFVSRDEAREVAIKAGQIHPSWKTAQRKLLSSDIDW